MGPVFRSRPVAPAASSRAIPAVRRRRHAGWIPRRQVGSGAPGGTSPRACRTQVSILDGGYQLRGSPKSPADHRPRILTWSSFPTASPLATRGQASWGWRPETLGSDPRDTAVRKARTIMACGRWYWTTPAQPGPQKLTLREPRGRDPKKPANDVRDRGIRGDLGEIDPGDEQGPESIVAWRDPRVKPGSTWRSTEGVRVGALPDRKQR
jgi:hypothetical protein